MPTIHYSCRTGFQSCVWNNFGRDFTEYRQWRFDYFERRARQWREMKPTRAKSRRPRMRWIPTWGVHYPF